MPGDISRRPLSDHRWIRHPGVIRAFYDEQQQTGRRAHVAGLIRARRKAIGSRWRKLPPGRQALLVLALLRHDQRPGQCNGISAATLRR
jgi:hypothetical protein